MKVFNRVYIESATAVSVKGIDRQTYIFKLIPFTVMAVALSIWMLHKWIIYQMIDNSPSYLWVVKILW